MAIKFKGRRMICKEIYESYEFLSLLNDTDCRLYTYLCLNTDDDGVVEALRVMRMINAPIAALEKLIELDFVKPLDNRDTIYVTHFQRFNQIDKRWVQPSKYRELLVKILPEVEKELFDAPKEVPEMLVSTSGENPEHLASISGGTRAITTTKTKTKTKTKNITTTITGEVGVVRRNDIDAYIGQCNYGHVNGDIFYDYYSRRNWMCNGAPIRDWRALVDLWEQNPKLMVQQRDYDFADLEKAIVANNP